jgi:hypothetical protein
MLDPTARSLFARALCIGLFPCLKSRPGQLQDRLRPVLSLYWSSPPGEEQSLINPACLFSQIGDRLQLTAGLRRSHPSQPKQLDLAHCDISLGHETPPRPRDGRREYFEVSSRKAGQIFSSSEIIQKIFHMKYIEYMYSYTNELPQERWSRGMRQMRTNLGGGHAHVARR